MEENRNMELKDDMMDQAVGGVSLDEHGMPKYDAFGKVVKYLGDQHYLVRLYDGGEVTATFNERHLVDEGTEVGLIALCGGWGMEESMDF